MTEQHDNAQLFVQIEATISRFAEDVRTTIGRQNEALAAEREARASLEQRIEELASKISNGQSAESAAVALEDHQRVADHERRIERIDERVDGFDQTLRKFDEHAARMVTHLTGVADDLKIRFEGLEQARENDTDQRFTDLIRKTDDLAEALQQQSEEVAVKIGRTVEPIEDRVNERLMATEVRLRDDIGVRAAELEAHVGQLSSGFDEVIATLNDRVSSVDGRFAELDEVLDGMRRALEGLDDEAITEMEEKISSALGQAELVRIEMERFKETVNDGLEKTTVRLTDVETMVRDQAQDVATAVQLERLEEVERAVLMLDPDAIRTSRPTAAVGEPNVSADEPLVTPEHDAADVRPHLGPPTGPARDTPGLPDSVDGPSDPITVGAPPSLEAPVDQ